MKKITIRDVASEAGVSVTLVSFVMNAKKDKNGKLNCPVSKEKIERVLDVAKRLGYRRNAAAASLRSGRSSTIGVIPTDISNRFFAGISRMIEDKAHKYGYNVLFASSDERADKLDRLIDTMLGHNIDGLIVAPCSGSTDILQKVVDANVPLVLLDRDIEELDYVGKVLLNDREAGYIATKALLDKGLQKVEMFSYTLSISSLNEREEGYKKAMREMKLEDNINIRYLTYGDGASDIANYIKEAIDNGVQGIFLPTYSLCALVLQSMKEQGLKTPENIAIVGFDESDIYNLYETTVTHIVQPLRELGDKSVEVLHRLIEKKEGETTIILKPEIIKGGSTENIK